FTISASPPPVTPPGGSDGTGADGTAPTVALSVPATLDAARGVELGTTVTLTNVSTSTISTMFRPDTILFTVTGPSGGTTTCAFPRQGATPIRELFTSTGPKQRASVTVLFTATCSPGTFDDVGIYRVWPRLDTTGTSGHSIGLKTWDGVVVAKVPLVVRIRN